MRYERKQGKIEKKQKVYFMPKSIECAHRKYKKVNTHIQYTGKLRESLLKYKTLRHCDEKLFLNHAVPQHRKGINWSRKRTTRLFSR